MARRLGDKKSSSRSGSGTPRERRRGARARPGRPPQGMRGRWRSKRSVTSTSHVVMTVMPMHARHQRDDGRAQRRDGPRRRGTPRGSRARKARTAGGQNSDSPTSPPRARWSDEGQGERPPRRWPRPGADPAARPGPGPGGRCRPAPPARRRSGVAHEGEDLEHEVEPAAQRRRDGAKQVDDAGHGDGPGRPPTDTAGPAAGRRSRSGAGGHEAPRG